MNRLVEGLWPVMITPLKQDGKIDFEVLEQLVDFYINAGAKGLFANCLSSEMFALSQEERIAITKCTVNTVRNRVPVISTGTFTSDLKENKSFFNKIYETGVQAVIINSNQLNLADHSESKFKSKLETLLNNTGNIPLGIYECPAPYKRLISPELLGWMSKTGRFYYFKDTSCDTAIIRKKLDAIKGSNLNFYNANIPTALDSLNYGAKGLSPIGANFFPELYAYLCDNFSNPEHKETINKINSFLCLIDPLIHTAYPSSAKWFLKKRGISMNTTTRADSIIEPQDTIKLEILFKAFGEVMKLTKKNSALI